MTHRPYPSPSRARRQVKRGKPRPMVDPRREAAFTRGCADAAASIDRQFQWMPPRVVLRAAAPALDYDACRDLVDAAYWERTGLRRSSR